MGFGVLAYIIVLFFWPEETIVLTMLAFGAYMMYAWLVLGEMSLFSNSI